MRSGIFSPKYYPSQKARYGNPNHDRHEDRSYLIYQSLNRGFASLGILHHLNDMSQNSIAAHFFGNKMKAPFLVDSTSIHLSPHYFLYRYGLPTDHTFIHK